MLAAIGMELGPDIFTILMPPVPAGEAIAAMVESSITTNTHPVAKWTGLVDRIYGQRRIGKLPEFFLSIILLTDGKNVVDQPVKNQAG